MFKLFFIFIIALSGCNVSSSTLDETASMTVDSSQTQQSSALTNKALSEVIRLDIKHLVEYQNVKLRLIDIEDSRCPTGESCIWAGQLIVSLEVINELNEKVAVKLIRKREAEIAYAFGYSLHLLSVEPQPKKGKVIQLSDQVVKLKIERSAVN